MSKISDNQSLKIYFKFFSFISWSFPFFHFFNFASLFATSSLEECNIWSTLLLGRSLSRLKQKGCPPPLLLPLHYYLLLPLTETLWTLFQCLNQYRHGVLAEIGRIPQFVKVVRELCGDPLHVVGFEILFGRGEGLRHDQNAISRLSEAESPTYLCRDLFRWTLRLLWLCDFRWGCCWTWALGLGLRFLRFSLRYSVS